MMKRSIVSVVLCVLALTVISAQDYPQYCFYLQPDLYDCEHEYKDDFNRLLDLLLKKLFLNNASAQYVATEYEIYKIESRLLLKYTTADDAALPYFKSLEALGTVADHTYDKGTFSAYFTNAPECLDSWVFTDALTSLELPAKADMVYSGSPDMSVANLQEIRGADVHFSSNASFLVDKNGTLIAGAVYGKTDILIPAHANSLGTGCLRGAKDLTTVRCRGDVSVIGERALDVPSDLSLYLERATPVEIHPLAFGDEMPYRIFVPDKKLAKAYKKLYPQWKKVIKVDKSLVK